MISNQPTTPNSETGAANGGFELGLYSFAELTPDPETGVMISPAERLRMQTGTSTSLRPTRRAVTMDSGSG